MKILLLADFGGSFPASLLTTLKSLQFDIAFVAGDFADIKVVRDLFLKYGDRGREYYNKLSKSRKKAIKRKKYRTCDRVLEKLNTLGKPIYLVSGNNEISDYGFFVKTVSKYKNCNLIDGKLVNIGNFAVVGNRSEQRVYGERSRTREDLYDYQERLLNKNFRKAKTKNIILLNHYPPHGCRLDKLPKNAKLNPGTHIGSYLIREFIEKYKPPFVVSGHLEELRGTCKIGKTTVINPGGADIGKYAILDVAPKLEKSKLKFYITS